MSISETVFHASLARFFAGETVLGAAADIALGISGTAKASEAFNWVPYA
jgi:hypothetical protein